MIWSCSSKKERVRTLNNPIKKERLEEDRKKGEQAEREFCKLMQTYGFFTHRFQKGYPKAAVLERDNEYILLPDTWVIPQDKPPFFAEVKAKYPSKYGAYGLEKYRAANLIRISDLTGVPIFYVIRDTREKKWFWQNLKNLLEYPYKEFWSKTYVAGEVKRLPTCYFRKSWFVETEENGKLNFPYRKDEL